MQTHAVLPINKQFLEQYGLQQLAATRTVFQMSSSGTQHY